MMTMRKHPINFQGKYFLSALDYLLLLFDLTLSTHPEPKVKMTFGLISGRKGEKKGKSRERREGWGRGRGEGKGICLPFSWISILFHKSEYRKLYSCAGKYWEGRAFFPPDSPSFQDHRGWPDCSHFCRHGSCVVAGITVIRITGRLGGKLMVGKLGTMFNLSVYDQYWACGHTDTDTEYLAYGGPNKYWLKEQINKVSAIIKWFY